MKLTRRNFIATATLGVGVITQFAGAVFGQTVRRSGDIFKIPAGMGGDRLAELSWDSFLPYVYSDFTFTKAGERGGLTLQLAEMVDTKPGGFAETKDHPCFMLKFKGPYIPGLKQGTYQVNHFALGDFELFVTDGGRKAKDNFNIAVINRMIS